MFIKFKLGQVNTGSILNHQSYIKYEDSKKYMELWINLKYKFMNYKGRGRVSFLELN